MCEEIYYYLKLVYKYKISLRTMINKKQQRDIANIPTKKIKCNKN